MILDHKLNFEFRAVFSFLGKEWSEEDIKAVDKIPGVSSYFKEVLDLEPQARKQLVSIGGLWEERKIDLRADNIIVAIKKEWTADEIEAVGKIPGVREDFEPVLGLKKDEIQRFIEFKQTILSVTKNQNIIAAMQKGWTADEIEAVGKIPSIGYSFSEALDLEAQKRAQLVSIGGLWKKIKIKLEAEDIIAAIKKEWTTDEIVNVDKIPGVSNCFYEVLKLQKYEIPQFIDFAQKVNTVCEQTTHIVAAMQKGWTADEIEAVGKIPYIEYSFKAVLDLEAQDRAQLISIGRMWKERKIDLKADNIIAAIKKEWTTDEIVNVGKIRAVGRDFKQVLSLSKEEIPQFIDFAQKVNTLYGETPQIIAAMQERWTEEYISAINCMKKQNFYDRSTFENFLGLEEDVRNQFVSWVKTFQQNQKFPTLSMCDVIEAIKKEWTTEEIVNVKSVSEFNKMKREKSGLLPYWLSKESS
jgi:hydroxyethylthiazole kinase-like sugar kinase family protein